MIRISRCMSSIEEKIEKIDQKHIKYFFAIIAILSISLIMAAVIYKCDTIHKFSPLGTMKEGEGIYVALAAGLTLVTSIVIYGCTRKKKNDNLSPQQDPITETQNPTIATKEQQDPLPYEKEWIGRTVARIVEMGIETVEAEKQTDLIVFYIEEIANNNRELRTLIDQGLRGNPSPRRQEVECRAYREAEEIILALEREARKEMGVHAELNFHTIFIQLNDERRVLEKLKVKEIEAEGVVLEAEREALARLCAKGQVILTKVESARSSPIYYQKDSILGRLLPSISVLGEHIFEMIRLNEERLSAMRTNLQPNHFFLIFVNGNIEMHARYKNGHARYAFSANVEPLEIARAFRDEDLYDGEPIVQIFPK